MQLTLGDSGIIKTSFEAICDIVDEVQILVESNVFRLSALDRSHITFVNLELKKDLFDEYILEEALKLNVDTEELFKVLKRGKSDDILTFKADEGNLIIIFENGDTTRTFKIRLIDIDYEPPSPPDLEWPIEVKDIPFALFKQGIQDAEVVSDKVCLAVDPEYFKMNAEGEFGDNDMQYLHGLKVDGSVQSIYSLEKIKSMLKSDKFTPEIQLKLGNNMPLHLSLVHDSGNGILSYLLAPRIESEE